MVIAFRKRMAFESYEISTYLLLVPIRVCRREQCFQMKEPISYKLALEKSSITPARSAHRHARMGLGGREPAIACVYFWLPLGALDN